MQRFFFDRLTQPLKYIPADEASQMAMLRESIREELQRLVSGRAYFDGFRSASSGHKSILNWGIDNPVDFGNSITEIKILMDQILNVVKTFEPRIKDPKAKLIPNPNNLKPAPLRPVSIQISGHIQLDSLSEPFSHDFSLGGDRQ